MSLPSRPDLAQAGMLADKAERRAGESIAVSPATCDASLFYIGFIRTPWPDRATCSKRGDPDCPDCRLQLVDPWTEALDRVDGAKILKLCIACI